jgi:hypothetical protein
MIALALDERSPIRAQAHELVHRFLVAAGGDWPALGGMITSTAELLQQRLLENRIPSDFAAVYSMTFLDEAVAEATRLRGAMTSEVGRA